VSASYGLAPEHAFPSQVDDARAALAWLQEQAAELGIDPDRLAVAGDSAGAYLAATVATEANAARPGAVRAQGLFYPLVHLDDEVWAQTLLRDARLIGRLAVAYINAQLASAHAPSLVEAIGPATPPTFLITGTVLDPVHPDAVDYARALAAAGVSVELKAYPGQAHGFANFTHVLPVAVEAVTTLGAQLGKALRDGS
jgi:acetyl esterase